MRYIAPLQTDRINAHLRELTIGEAIELAGVPEHTEEVARTRLLRAIVISSTGLVPDPADWTVEERIYAVAHYLSAVDDEPNIRIHGGGVLTDYVRFDDAAVPDVIDLADFGAAGLTLTQMTGAQSELVQPLASTALDWTFADMAVRLRRNADDRPCHKTAPAEFTGWVSRSMDALRGMPASDFEPLFAAYAEGKQRLAHIWRIAFDDLGHVCLPKDKEAGLSPARFQVSDCAGELACGLARLLA